MEAGTEQLRIGELSRRTGVRPELLRAWERRYGLLRPSRTDGGFRLYSPADERRVSLMRSHLQHGMSAAEAAQLALTEADDDGRAQDEPLLQRRAEELREALNDLDESAAQTTLDSVLAEFAPETVLANLVLPYLRELGERWASGEASVGQEHFASQLLRGRLLGLARGWDRGAGPRALLACAPGELHDFGLIAFGLALRARGWRITYLGQDTPLETLAETARSLEPQAIVIAAASPDRLSRSGAELRRLARTAKVWLAGPGASAALAKEARAAFLDVDPLTAADRVAATRPEVPKPLGSVASP
jgi:MerR family transcriptional regulator, light-induced transcriptional regulator